MTFTHYRTSYSLIGGFLSTLFSKKTNEYRVSWENLIKCEIDETWEIPKEMTLVDSFGLSRRWLIVFLNYTSVQFILWRITTFKHCLK